MQGGHHRIHAVLYLLDANVFIDAERDYYSLDRVPEFWNWLIHMGETGRIKTPQEIYEEVVVGKGELVNWMKENKATLVLEELAPSKLVTKVLERGYANNLTDEEIEKIGRDPFLIAYALADVNHRCIVTTEHSRPNKRRANRHIPDVCSKLGSTYINTFQLIRRLNFRTDWQSA